MAIKKSELYSSLWKSCDELRGGMDASQYKDYVLILPFVKYVSDKYAGEGPSLSCGRSDHDAGSSGPKDLKIAQRGRASQCQTRQGWQA
jgi:type I restriction-modification system DNA methylase subunit